MTTHLRMIFGKRVKSKLVLVSVMMVFCLSGCGTQKIAKIGPVFFPPPPDEPHIQYLTGINDSADVGEKKSRSSFSLVLTGKEGVETIRKLGKSYGITAQNGKLYLAESANGEIVVIDPAKGTFESLKGLAHPKGALKGPVNVALDKDGYLYVADTGRNEIVVFDENGNYAKTFGENFPKETKIVAVAVYGDILYALDTGTSQIRVLDRKTGEETGLIGKIDKPNQSLRVPSNITVDSAGSIYVANIGNNRVIKYDRDGNFLASFGGSGDNPGLFARPKGVAVDDAGRVFVVDAGLNVVHLFDKQGRILTYFGQPGLPAGSLNLPAGIAVTKDNLQLFQKFAAPGFQLEELIFVVSQFGQEFKIPRISVYGLGQMQGKGADPKQGNSDKK